MMDKAACAVFIFSFWASSGDGVQSLTSRGEAVDWRRPTRPTPWVAPNPNLEGRDASSVINISKTPPATTTAAKTTTAMRKTTTTTERLRRRRRRRRQRSGLVGLAYSGPAPRSLQLVRQVVYQLIISAAPAGIGFGCRPKGQKWRRWWRRMVGQHD